MLFLNFLRYKNKKIHNISQGEREKCLKQHGVPPHLREQTGKERPIRIQKVNNKNEKHIKQINK